MTDKFYIHEEAAYAFDQQLSFAKESYKNHGIKASNLSNVVIGGLGGSGIGGQFARNFFQDKSPIPIEVVSEYNLPSYAGRNTLVIISSYSGNTEETISMFSEALQKGCKCIAISTGGEIEHISKQNNVLFHQVASGYQPRMALGFSLTTLLLILGELLNYNVQNDIAQAIQEIQANKKEIKKRGENLLNHFKDQPNNKFVLVSGGRLSAVALRACQQIQENAKAEAFYHVLPECNHNVTESYYGKLPSNFIFLKGLTHERTNYRFDFFKELLESYGNPVATIELSSPNLYGILEMTLVLDWLSILLSDLRKVNNMEVPNISKLKQYLSNIN